MGKRRPKRFPWMEQGNEPIYINDHVASGAAAVLLPCSSVCVSQTHRGWFPKTKWRSQIRKKRQHPEARKALPSSSGERHVNLSSAARLSQRCPL